MPPLSLLCLGPSPALQRVLSFDAPPVLGGVHRATSLSTYVGGKGQGVGLALQRWAPGAPTVAQFAGGETGEAVGAMLGAAGVRTLTQRVHAHTRTCITLVDPSTPGGTELIDPSGEVLPEEVDARACVCVDRLD